MPSILNICDFVQARIKHIYIKHRKSRERKKICKNNKLLHNFYSCKLDPYYYSRPEAGPYYGSMYINLN